MRAACRARSRRDPIAPAGTLGRRTRRRTNLALPSRSSLRRTLARRDLERPPRPLHRSSRMQHPRSADLENWRLPSLEHAAESCYQLTPPERHTARTGAPVLATTLWKEATASTAPSAAFDAARNAVLDAAEVRSGRGAAEAPQRQGATHAGGPAPYGTGPPVERRAYGTGTSTGPTTSMLSNLVFVRYCTTSMVADLGSPYSLKSSGPVTPS